MGTSAAPRSRRCPRSGQTILHESCSKNGPSRIKTETFAESLELLAEAAERLGSLDLLLDRTSRRVRVGPPDVSLHEG